MASTAQHLAVAARVNATQFNFEGNDLKEFFIGAIACDVPKLELKKDVNAKKVSEIEKFPNKMRKVGRNYSHFAPGSIIPENQGKSISPEITIKYGYTPVDDRPEAKVDYNQFVPMVDYFKEKYAEQMNEPFMLGYLTHLVTDKVYFVEVVPTIVEENKDVINDYINNKYGKFGYKKKEYLTNAEYLDWAYDALYSVFDDYSYLSLFETKDVFPNLSDLGDYLEKWESSARTFKPSIIEDLNNLEAIIAFLKNPRISNLIVDAKKQLEEGNIINRKDLSFNSTWPYELYLDFNDKVEDEINRYINSTRSRK